MVKILDCTLRDGGYYTKWDFDSNIVDTYLNSMNILPVNYVEVGYRNNPSEEYLGKFGYTPVSVLRHVRNVCRKKISVMINEKNTRPEHVGSLLLPIVGLADMIRIAIDPKNFDRAIELAWSIKEMGFEVGFNCMYMSKWQSEYNDFIDKLHKLDNVATLFCMVDSYGGITPKEVENIYMKVRHKTSCTIGFHGHNNLQLGLINTLTAKALGCGYIDATILGMGRGAGNVNMELLLAYLNAHEGLEVDFNVLGNVISAFSPLMNRYHWGPNLPYMLSGANQIPQKEVMEWVNNRVYSFNTIVRALENRKDHVIDNAKFPVLEVAKQYEYVLVIGGGSSVDEHIDAIKEFVSIHNESALLFATAKKAALFIDFKVPKYYCLTGDEGRRLTKNVGKNDFEGKCILSPFPRTMGTDVPEYADKNTFELKSMAMLADYKDSVTAIALETAFLLTKKDIYFVGYDGYSGNQLSEKEIALSAENEDIFRKFKTKSGRNLYALTPSLYRGLKELSIYQLI